MSRTRRERAALLRKVAALRRQGRVFSVMFRVKFDPDWPPPLFADRPWCFDREGEPLHWMEWAVLHSFRSYCYVAGTAVGDFWVATDWIGHDMSLGLPGPPETFETMVFGDKDQEDLHPELRVFVNAMVRYATAAEAEAGHDAICMEIRQTMAKIKMAEEVHAEAMSG